MKTFLITLSVLGFALSAVAVCLGVVNYTQLQDLQTQLDTNTQIGQQTTPLTNKPNQMGKQGGAQQQNSQDVVEHKVYVTRSSNPESFTDTDTVIFAKASVPEAVLLTHNTDAGTSGDLLMYFPSFEQFTGNGTEQLVYSRSTDNGVTWSTRQPITLSNKPYAGAAVDPSLVELPDGKLRMYFFGTEGVGGDPAKQDTSHNFYSAVSSDGVHFVVEEGVRISLPQVTDPEVVELNGTWIMYISKGAQTLIATSTDGLAFTLQDQTWDGGGVPGAYVDADDTVHLYGCGKGGIATIESTDGITFGSAVQSSTALQSSSTETPVICDPSPVLLPDGDVLMVYKKA